MAKPTDVDFINAHLATDRIMLRKMFEELRDHRHSKYFKNVVIRNVEWKDKTFLHCMPPNMPEEFLKKYPYDFEVSYTTRGCNMLKCYRHKKGCSTPTLINNYVEGCGEACFFVYQEFDKYLREKFQLNNEDEKDQVDRKHNEDNDPNKDDDDDDDDDDILPFETFSIHDETVRTDHTSNINNNKNKAHNKFCGIQLTSLKTYSILPSSRWWNDQNISVRDYVNKYQNEILPLQLRELSGLVDAPPLTWNVDKQNASFNVRYCRRFHKLYNSRSDECFETLERKGLKYLFGENFINMFPDISVENIMKGDIVPFEHLYNALRRNGLQIDRGFTEKPIPQEEFERRIFTDKSDRVTHRSRIIDKTSYSIKEKRRKTAITVNNVFADVLSDLGKNTAIEMSLTTLPTISARLLKYFSSTFLEKALILQQHASGLPASVRLFSLTARAVINDLTIKIATRMLTFISRVANVLFTLTIVTLIPDVILGYYNVGGFNNEISREHLTRLRQSYMDSLLKSNVARFGNTLNYIVLDDEGSSIYASPLVSPEFVYHLCLLNFLKRNPDKNISICYNGLGPEQDREDIALEYIKHLKINSVGQIIRYKTSIHDANVNNISKNINTDDEEDNRVFIQSIYNRCQTSGYIESMIENNIDVYTLIVVTILFMLSLFLFLFDSSSSYCYRLFYGGLIFYFVWFSLFRPV